ncbi:hypothetical protein [Mycobacterium sp. DL592]|uniref:hypothetical protein n=1 Tax=Mycobacterium sp. DL592 TaxID=2675524 RepID=UPI0014220AEB|nr:hypothetical protein [Mycobacterium sp. DL592]
MSIPGELERARQLILAAKEEAAKDLLLSVLPEIEREDRDDLALEVFALLGELYLNRTAYDGTEECIQRIDDCLAAYADAAPGSEEDHMRSRYRLRAQFLRVGLAAAYGEHEAAATELVALQDDDCVQRFPDLAADRQHLGALAGVLCATALSDDDLHPRAAALWRKIIPVIDDLTEPSDAVDQLLVTGGLAYGRFCVETGRLAEGEQWLHRAGARAQRRDWKLYCARAELETAAASWMRGDHQTTERLVGGAYPVIAEGNRAHDVSRSWLYFGLTRLGVGMVEAADESWSHAERHWRELGKPLHIHRILVQRSWISVFRGRFAEALELVAQARELLDQWPRSSWLQYARLDDHLGNIWRADALADMGFDGISEPTDDFKATEARQAASLGVTRVELGSDAHRSAMAKLERAAEFKIPAALAVDSVRYSMMDAESRWRWGAHVSGRMLAGAFSVAWEWENTELLSELIEYHSARGTFAHEPLGEASVWDSGVSTAVVADTAAEEALAAGGGSVDGLTLTTLGPLPRLQMDPARAPILEHYRQLAASRYGQTVTADGPAWSTWP